MMTNSSVYRPCEPSKYWLKKEIQNKVQMEKRNKSPAKILEKIDWRNEKKIDHDVKSRSKTVIWPIDGCLLFKLLKLRKNSWQKMGKSSHEFVIDIEIFESKDRGSLRQLIESNRHMTHIDFKKFWKLVELQFKVRISAE